MNNTDFFLEDLSEYRARNYIAAIRDMLLAATRRDRVAYSVARERFGDVVSANMGTAEVIGASFTLRKAASVLPEEGGATMRAGRVEMLRFANEPLQTLIPGVTFEEAVDDMVDRTPVTLKRAAERTAQRIAQLYSEKHVVAFVRAAEEEVTKKAQRMLRDALREGMSEAEFGRMSSRDFARFNSGWTESYGRMAYRTNANTAATAGRFRQAQDQDVRAVIPAFMFDANDDDDTRPNHKAADGLIFRVDNVAWNKIASPLGYNCRCDVLEQSLPQLRRLGRIDRAGRVIESRGIPSTAFPDPGFRHGGRPDLFIVQGVGAA